MRDRGVESNNLVFNLNLHSLTPIPFFGRERRKHGKKVSNSPTKKHKEQENEPQY